MSHNSEIISKDFYLALGGVGLRIDEPSVLKKGKDFSRQGGGSEFSVFHTLVSPLMKFDSRWCIKMKRQTLFNVLKSGMFELLFIPDILTFLQRFL